MAKIEEQENTAVVEEQVVSDDSMTQYGFTVGQLVQNAQTEIKQVRDEAAGVQRKLDQANETITKLTAALEAAKTKPSFTDEEIAAAVKSIRPERGIRTMPDGSIILPQVRVNVDSASQLLSWAQDAGEDPVAYISKAIDEGLLLYTSQ